MTHLRLAKANARSIYCLHCGVDATQDWVLCDDCYALACTDSLVVDEAAASVSLPVGPRRATELVVVMAALVGRA